VKAIYVMVYFVLLTTCSNAQELYVFTEPASNMPAKSIGLRVNTKLSRMNHDRQWDAWRINPEVMIGVTKNLMLHVSGFSSNMFQERFRIEGGGFYAKYRFYSSDDIHRHFRLAAFGRINLVENPSVLKRTKIHKIPDGNGGTISHHVEVVHLNHEIDTEGEVSTTGGGLIATQLINRLALSATGGYNYRLNNLRTKKESILPSHAINWSASAGYLLLPKEYQNYRQTNLNLYLEVLGYNTLDRKASGIDVAPAIQFIFLSVARLDMGYRTQLTARGERFSNSSFNVRFEYDILNAFGKKSK
jgi:hypothetical protein